MQRHYIITPLKVTALVIVLFLTIWTFWEQSVPVHQTSRRLPDTIISQTHEQEFSSTTSENRQQQQSAISSLLKQEFARTKGLSNMPILAYEATTPYQINKSNEVEDLSEISIYSHSFDRGFDTWEGNKSIWQVGAPVAGPSNLCDDDSMCIGTVLNEHYPDFENAKLSSPSINLPNLEKDEIILFQLSNWFEIDLHDQVEISISHEIQNNFWADPDLLLVQSGQSSAWQQLELDLSSFAGQKVRLHFELIQSEERKGIGSGWYIDDLHIKKIKQTQS